MDDLLGPSQGGPETGAGPDTAARALACLRAHIRDEHYQPGDRLPPERTLTGTLGVSRGALRKAFEALEREGAIWRHVGKGTFIASADTGPAGTSLVEIGRQLTPFRMMRARLCIEPAIAREAAVNASAESMARMQAAMDRAAAASTWGEYEAHDDGFHRTIAEAADNLLLLTLFDQLNTVRRAVAWGAVDRASVKPPPDHPSFAEHAAIAAAVARRDRDGAHDAMRAHLRSVSARLFDGA
jgi:DNA-binding FadR family transcriptional regulator